MIRVFAIFKKTIYINALQPFLYMNGIEVVSICNNLALAVDQYTRLDVDLVLMDANWPEGIHALNGDSVIRQLKSIDPQIKIIAATNFFDTWTLSKLKAQNVQGYFYRNMEDTLAQIRNCIKLVHQGENYYAEPEMTMLVNARF